MRAGVRALPLGGVAVVCCGVAPCGVVWWRGVSVLGGVALGAAAGCGGAVCCHTSFSLGAGAVRWLCAGCTFFCFSLAVLVPLGTSAACLFRYVYRSLFPPLSASITPLLSISMTIKNGI